MPRTLHIRSCLGLVELIGMHLTVCCVTWSRKARALAGGAVCGAVEALGTDQRECCEHAFYGASSKHVYQAEACQ